MRSESNYKPNQMITGGVIAGPMTYNVTTKEWEPYQMNYENDFSEEHLPDGVKVNDTVIGYKGLIKTFTGLTSYIGQDIYADLYVLGGITVNKTSCIHLGFVISDTSMIVDIYKNVPADAKIGFTDTLSTNPYTSDIGIGAKDINRLALDTVNSKILISDYLASNPDGSVFVKDLDLVDIDQLPQSSLYKPLAVAIDPGTNSGTPRIFVARLNDTIRVYNAATYAYISDFGSSGASDGQFDSIKDMFYKTAGTYANYTFDAGIKKLFFEAKTSGAPGANVTIEYVNGILASAMTRANSLKANYESHRVDGTAHGTAADTVNVITAADATDLSSLIALVTDMLPIYEAHDDDAEIVTPGPWLYHSEQEASDHSLVSITAPTTLQECIDSLNDFYIKLNGHDNDASSHSSTGGYQETGDKAGTVSLAINVVSNAIDITLGATEGVMTSTAADIKVAVDGDGPASALVNVTAGGTGIIDAAMAATNLFWGDILIVGESGNLRTQEFDSALSHQRTTAASSTVNGVHIDAAYRIYRTTESNGAYHTNYDGTDNVQIAADGSAENQISSPQGLTLDNDLNVFIADNGNGTLKIFDNDGNYLTEIESVGTEYTTNCVDVEINGATIYVAIRNSSTDSKCYKGTFDLTAQVDDGTLVYYDEGTSTWKPSVDLWDPVEAVKTANFKLLYVGHSFEDISVYIDSVDINAYQYVYRDPNNLSKMKVSGSPPSLLLATVNAYGVSGETTFVIPGGIVPSLVGVPAKITIVGGADNASEYVIESYTPNSYGRNVLEVRSNINNTTGYQSSLSLTNFDVSDDDTSEVIGTDLTGVPIPNQYIHRNEYISPDWVDIYYKVTNLVVNGGSNDDVVHWTPGWLGNLSGSVMMYEYYTAQILVTVPLLGYYVKDHGFYFQRKN